MPYLIAFVIVIALIVLAIQYWYITVPVVVMILALIYGPGVMREWKKNKYFASQEFLDLRDEAQAIVSEHNEIEQYVQEISTSGTLNLGSSSTGKYSHLATSSNTSAHNYTRARNTVDVGDPQIHVCSLAVVRKASEDPLKYLTKYFDFQASDETLSRLESYGNDIERLENALENLADREEYITNRIQPPVFIREYYLDLFLEQVGVTLPDVNVPYAEYVFAYVSAGGNSSQKTTISFDTETVDAFMGYLQEKINYRKSSAGQRALMTTRLRAFIKERDDETCQLCGISTTDEPHLLIEVDHIIPISRGGLTIESNLQALCWRCNRTKSNKMPELT